MIEDVIPKVLQFCVAAGGGVAAITFAVLAWKLARDSISIPELPPFDRTMSGLLSILIACLAVTMACWVTWVATYH